MRGPSRTAFGQQRETPRIAVAAALVIAMYAQTACPPRETLAPQTTASDQSVISTGATAAPTTAPSKSAPCSPTPLPSPTRSQTPTATATSSTTASPTVSCTPIPLPTPDGVLRTVRVPILMYHYISSHPESADEIRLDLSLPPKRFEEHLRYLREHGYTTITLHDLALALQIGQPLPQRPIILTFDDGYRDHYTQAFPLLRKYGFRGTFFVITSHIDQEHRQYLSWDQVKEMAGAGMEIESHGYTHVDLRQRTVDYLVWQMVGSREAIEERTRRPVRFFCYPAGKYDDLAIKVLHSAHYWGAVTVKPGVEHRSDAMFELRRIRIHGDYGARALASVLR